MLESDSLVRETFDPSWKHIFAWGYDPKTGRFDAWPIKGDHRREHKQKLNELWGREPKARHGDVMGVATYIPEERKIDGSAVAPPHMLFQPYYNHPTPMAAQEWAEREFPGVVSRNARLSADASAWAEFDPDDEDDPEGTMRWIWNQKDGILIQPTSDFALHDDMTNNSWGRPSNAKDFRGYALPEGDDKIEIECFDPSIPPIAYEQIKTELSKMFPDKQIVLPHEIHADAGVTFGNDPAILTRKNAASQFMQRVFAETYPTPSQMPLEGTESLSDAFLEEVDVPARTSKESILFRGLRKVMGLPSVQAGSAADKDGAMVALFIPSDVGEKLKVKSGEPVEDMHITLAYFAEKAADRDDWDKVTRIVEQIAKNHSELKGKINGAGIFSNDVDVLWAAPSVPGLAELRDDIVEACEDAGFTVSTDHGWTPHITLKYDFKGKLPVVEIPEFHLDTLTFARGDNQEHFLLEGGFEKETSEWRPPLMPPGKPGDYQRFLDYYRLWDVAKLAEEAARMSQGNPQSYKMTNNWAAIQRVLREKGWNRVGAFENFESFNPDQWWGEHPSTGDRMEFGPQTWSGWKGAYRFTTDGEHFLKEPEEDLREAGFGWHGGGHGDLENRFRSMYHTKGPLVSGWAVPTADEMGYGILAPSMGLLGPDEPGMHELIRTLDQEFEKPCHFVNSWKDIVDPKRYAIYPEGRADGWTLQVTPRS